jgi:hypothetical protein
MNKREVIIGMFCAVIAAALPQAAIAQDKVNKQLTAAEISKMKPSATVTFDEEEIRLIIGGAHGKGVLTFQGKTYPFTLKGLSAGGVGIAKVHAVGNVYQLNNAADFTGRYTGVTAGATAVKGRIAASFQNGKGVYMSLKEKTSGAELAIGISEFDVQFPKK